jgi:energy-coupling factor transporter ATP-binding protein EcfA2
VTAPGRESVAAASSSVAAPTAPMRRPGMAVECRDLSFSYSEGPRRVVGVEAVSLALAAGSRTALLGASGSGKSTLLLLLRGLLEAQAGTVLLDGVGPADRAYGDRQREVGLVFQQPEMQLFAGTAVDDVAFGPRQLGWAATEVQAAAAAAMEAVGLPEDSFGGRHPYSLSGGEQRRLALAGVLAMRPRALQLDEPFVSLDPGARRELAAVLGRLACSGITLLLVTHDIDVAWELCDRRLVLSSGRVAASGSWDLGGGGDEVLERERLRVPALVQLWRRLGRPAATAPRTADEAAEALA